MNVPCRNIGCNHERNGFCTNCHPCGGADSFPESEQSASAPVETPLAGSVIESQCVKCGTEYFIETGLSETFRADGKRIYPLHETDKVQCQFRCVGCSEVVSKCVPGAEHGDVPNVKHEPRGSKE